jgi:hypothetical protein
MSRTRFPSAYRTESEEKRDQFIRECVRQETYTTGRIAHYLSLSSRTIATIMDRGDMPGFFRGENEKDRLIRAEDFQKWIAEKGMQLESITPTKIYIFPQTIAHQETMYLDNEIIGNPNMTIALDILSPHITHIRIAASLLNENKQGSIREKIKTVLKGIYLAPKIQILRNPGPKKIVDHRFKPAA